MFLTALAVSRCTGRCSRDVDEQRKCTCSKGKRENGSNVTNIRLRNSTRKKHPGNQHEKPANARTGVKIHSFCTAINHSASEEMRDLLTPSPPVPSVSQIYRRNRPRRVGVSDKTSKHFQRKFARSLSNFHNCSQFSANI